MNNLSQEVFEDSLNLLAEAYASEHPVFSNSSIFGIWYEFLGSKFTNENFTQAVNNYIATSKYFPRAPIEIWENWQASQPEQAPPGERYNQLQINSAEQNVDNLTPQQMEENYLRMKLILQLTMGKAQCIGKAEKDKLINQMRKMPILDLKLFVKKWQIN